MADCSHVGCVGRYVCRSVQRSAHGRAHRAEITAYMKRWRLAHGIPVRQPALPRSVVAERHMIAEWMRRYRERKARAVATIAAVRALYPDLVDEVFPNG